MAVSLGRSITSPFFVFAQIVNGVSLFFLLLGLFRVLIASWALRTVWMAALTSPQRNTTDLVASTTGQPSDHSKVAAEGQLHGFTDARVSDTTFSEVLQGCLHISLASLFDGPVDVRVAGSGLKTQGNTVSDSSRGEFFYMHLFTSLAMVYPLAVSLQRRKFVLDFVLTIYVVYIVFTDVMLARLLGGGSVHWWATILFNFGVTYGATWLVCKRRELADISLGSGAASGSAAQPLMTAVTTTGGQMNEENSVEMLEVRRAAGGATPPPMMRSQSPRAVLTAAAAVGGSGGGGALPEQTTGHLSVPAPGSATKWKDR